MTYLSGLYNFFAEYFPGNVISLNDISANVIGVNFINLHLTLWNPTYMVKSTG